MSIFLLRRARAVVWSPHLLTRSILRAWWCADDHAISSLMTDDGSGLISSWKDRISGTDLTAATTARPTWGATAFDGVRPGVSFNGTSNTLRGTSFGNLPVGTEPGEIWAVSTEGTTGRILCTYGGTASGTFRQLYESTTTVRATNGIVTSVTGSGNITTWTGPAIGSAEFTDTSVEARMNGRPNGFPGTGATLNTGTTRIAMGSNNQNTAANFWSGTLRHLLITTGMPLSQKQMLEGWLARDSGLQGSLTVSGLDGI